MEKYEFDAEILQSEEVGAGAFFLFPYDTMECFGKKNMIKIECTFDGIPYRGSIVNMGLGPCVGILKSIREKLGKGTGDSVHVVLWKDEAERMVEILEELLDALNENPKAKEFYNTLSYSNQKQYTDFISTAKKAETKAARVQTAIEKLNAGVKRLK